MALGDGIRRNIRTVSQDERNRFSRALLAMQGKQFPGQELDGPPVGVRYWFRQIEAQLDTQDHRGAEFLPWHREVCNRLEQLLREVDPDLSLHYWDWNEDPRDLFTKTATTDNVAFAEFGLPFEPAELLMDGRVPTAPDWVILRAPTFRRLCSLLEAKYDEARFVYFGGTIVNGHISFHDPLAILLHSNVDRLFAMWQAEGGHSWRLDPSRVYGEDDHVLGNLFVEPWSTETPSRPWVAPATPQAPKTCVHPTIVAPPCYDTLPLRVSVDEVGNPSQRITFRDVCAGRTFARAASFRVFGRGNARFTVTEGPTGPYSVITPGAAVTVAHSSSLYQEARIWFGFTGVDPNTFAPPGTVTITCDQTNEEFVFTLHANTIELPADERVPAMNLGGGIGEPAAAGARSNVTWTWTWHAAHG